MSSKVLIGSLVLSCLAAAYVPLPHLDDRYEPLTLNTTSFPVSPLVKRDGDPADMTWIKRWAAIGDSYTAGIGAGRPLGHMYGAERLNITLPDGSPSGHDDWYCARYDRAYPKVIERQFGSHVETDGGFQYLACSGDRSNQIYQQAQALEGNLDFVTLTSGGNDLCLAGIIKDCIMLPYGKRSACNTVIEKAEENVDSIITDNVRQVLEALNPKMNDDGIVVLNSYAQFFDTSSSNCDKQSWDALWFSVLGIQYQPLTIARRERFNNLVIKINEALREAVNQVAENDDINFRVGYAEWDRWVWDAVDGQMCSPSSNGDYPDKNQPDMQFIKPDTHPWFSWLDDVDRGDLRKRGAENATYDDLTESQKRQVDKIHELMEERDRRIEKNLYDSILFKSTDPRAEVKHRLNPRDPAPPGCPGDGGSDYTFGLGMPDQIGRNFHPNINGHVTIASFALAELMDLRSQVLSVDAPSCRIKDQFLCHSSGDSKNYVAADRADRSYKRFCKKVADDHPSNTINWSFSETYDKGTPEEHEYTVTLDNGRGVFDQEECEDSFGKLIHSCDAEDNPMNWKQGGKFIRQEGDYTYELDPMRTERPWPPPDKTYGRCEGWYKFLWSSYTVEGAGFSTWDYGQKTMLPNMNRCYGHGTTNWKFVYHDDPSDHNGYEWKATFRTPIWVRSRCWKNNKVVKGAGGYTDGCGGND